MFCCTTLLKEYPILTGLHIVFNGRILEFFLVQPEVDSQRTTKDLFSRRRAL